MDIIQLVGKDPQVKEWISNLEEKMPRQLITGLAGSAKTLLFARAFKKTNKNMTYHTYCKYKLKISYFSIPTIAGKEIYYTNT